MTTRYKDKYDRKAFIRGERDVAKEEHDARLMENIEGIVTLLSDILDELRGEPDMIDRHPGAFEAVRGKLQRFRKSTYTKG